MGELWVPTYKSWRLNEKSYGALQGLNKAETAAKYGEDQVLLWRRSYDVQPPLFGKKTTSVTPLMTAAMTHSPMLRRQVERASRTVMIACSPFGSAISLLQSSKEKV